MDLRIQLQQSPENSSMPTTTAAASAATAVQKSRPQSRRIRTRFAKRQWQQRTTSIALQIKDQEHRWWQKEQSLLLQVDLEIEAAYGLVAYYKLSARHNASIALATMPVWLYHGRPTRMAFHDLPARLKPPKNLRSLFGLNLKFVPNPIRNVPWATFEREILPRFDRDLQVKVFLAGAETDPTIPRTHTIQRCTLRPTGSPPTSLLQ
jgi:hypothetical protein